MKIGHLFVILGLLSSCGKTSVQDSSNVQKVSACMTAWGQVIPEGAKVAGYLADRALCNDECQSIEFSCEGGVFKQNTGTPLTEDQKVFPNCIKETKCSCVMPGDVGQLSDGVSVALYSQATVLCGESCDSKKINATCSDGILKKVSDSSTITGASSSCSVNPCSSCRAPWDNRIEVSHNETITGFIQESLGCLESCEAGDNAVQIRCQNGVWSKVTTTTTSIEDLKGTCKVRTQCNCTSADGTTYVHNPTASFTMYGAATGTCAKVCGAGATYSCKNGSFYSATDQAVSADTLFGACKETCLFCDTAQVDSSTGKKIKIAANSQKVLYQNDTVACGQSCLAGIVRCSVDGKISVVGGGNPDSFAYPGCSVAACTACSVPWSGSETLANNSTVTRYVSSSAACNESCDNKMVRLKCSGGSLQILSAPNGTTIPSLSTSVASCTQAICSTCTLGGKTYNSGESVAAYSQNTVPCGQTCTDASIYTTRTCVNGAFSGSASYQYTTCTSSCTPTYPENVTSRSIGDSSIEGGGAVPYLCPVLGGRSFLLPGTQVSYYTRNKVACGETCETYRKVLTCHGSSGLLGFPASNQNTGILEPVYFSCKEVCT